MDVTSEWVIGLRPDRFVGVQPWAWHQGDKIEDLPDELYCTTAMKAEREITRDPENLTGLLEQFCLNVVPWYYRNNTTATEGTQQMRDGDDTRSAGRTS